MITHYKRIIKNAEWVVKAILTNQVAKCSSSLYVRWTQDTGRGEKGEDAARIAEYFNRCFREYLEQLSLNDAAAIEYFRGSRILEYGPGDILGVALLLYAYGAETVQCVDRFPLKKASDQAFQIYRLILESLKDEQRERANNAFVDSGKPESGFRPGIIDYAVTQNGMSGRFREYDLILSRAVLEHVNDIDETIRDIDRSLKPKGISLHKIDLRSHGLDRYRTLDFLSWPEWLYRLMYSNKGYPNRFRVDRYRDSVSRSDMKFIKLEATEKLDHTRVKDIYPKLAEPFQRLSFEDLSWLGFWMLLEHR